MRLRYAIVAAMLLAQPSLTQAQGDARQTPENANKFLVLSLNNVSLSGDGDATGYIDVRTQNVQATTDVCTISIGYSGTRNYMNRTGDQDVYSQTFTLNFQNVTDIQTGSGNITLAYTTYIDGTRMHTIRLGQPSADMSARVGFAMNFLKSHCNPADQTGF